MRTGRLQLAIDSDLTAVGGLAGAVRGFLSELDVPEPFSLELCVVEAVNNAIEHAYAGALGYEVAVEICVDVDEVTITVTDRGQAMCADALLPSGADEGWRERGRGLVFIRELVDARYATDGDVNRFVMRRAARG